jgi:hypothetical protein
MKHTPAAGPARPNRHRDPFDWIQTLAPLAAALIHLATAIAQHIHHTC